MPFRKLGESEINQGIENNPLVTLVVPTFNQAQVVEEALRAAFNQTYSPLLIRVSDDASTDNTFEVINRVCLDYRGPHRIQISRNAENLGLSKHFSMLSRTFEGELLVWAAGDDVSLPTRVAKLVECYLNSGRTMHYLCSKVTAMSSQGVLQGEYQSPGASAASSPLLSAWCSFPLAVGASEAWSKTLANRFPDMSAKVWAEDQVFGFRGRLIGPIGFVDESLVRYRSGFGLTTRATSFSLRRYLKNQLNGIYVYKQRAKDAAHVGRFELTSLIYLKIVLLYCLLPVSPVLSLLRRGRHTQRVFKYL